MPEWALCSKGRLPECIVAWTCFFLSASPHTAFCNERSPPVKFNDILDVFSRASSLYIYIWLIVNQMCINKCIKLSNKDFFIFYPIDAPKNGYHINISGYRDLFLWRLEYQTFKWVILQKPKWIKYQCYMCWLSLTPIQGVYSLHHNLILQFNQSFGLTPKPQIIIIANTPIGKNSDTIVP